MPSALYLSETAATANKPEFRVQIEGIPYDWTTNNALCLTSYTPPYIGATPYRKIVAGVTLDDDSIDRTTGRTEFGGATVSLVDAGDVLTALFRRAPSISILLGDGIGGVAVTATGTTWAVPDASVFTVGQSYCCGRETIRCTGRDLGLNTITVTRGCFGSIATPHFASLANEPHDDEIYAYAPHWVGRMLSIYFEYDTPTFVAADALLRFCGPIDSIKLAEDGNTWEIGAKSALAQLGGKIGGTVYRGVTARDEIFGPGGVVLRTGGLQAIQLSPDDGRQPWEPTYLRIGDEVLSTAGTAAVASRRGYEPCSANQRGEVGTPVNHPVGSEYHECLITRYNPGTSTSMGDPPYPFGFLYGGPPPVTFVTSGHPIAVLLNLACSSYAGDNYDPSFAPLGVAYGPVSFDTMNATSDACLTRIGLPTGSRRGGRLGRWVPWQRINWQSFWDVMNDARIATFYMEGFEFPDRDGGFDVLKWWEDRVASVLGAYLYRDDDGLIALGFDRDVYPLDAVTTLDDGDVIPGSVSLDLSLEETISQLDIQYSAPLERVNVSAEAQGPGWGGLVAIANAARSAPIYLAGPTRTLVANAAVAQERFPQDENSVSIDATGYVGDDTALLMDRAVRILDRCQFPRPKVRATLAWNQHPLIIGEVVKLNFSDLPDMDAGTRSSDGPNATVVRSSADPEEFTTSVEFEIDVESNLGHVAPSGHVTGYNPVAVPHPTITLDIEEYAAPGANALDHFLVGDRLRTQTNDGVATSDNVVTILSRDLVTGVLELSAVFMLGMAPTIVLPVLTFAPMTAAAIAAAPDMADFVAYATDGSTIPPDAIAPYRYGA